jgi:methyltransferase family protein
MRHGRLEGPAAPWHSGMADEMAATPDGLTEHAARNRAMWDGYSDEYQATHGDELAASGGLAWGTTQIPEADLRVAHARGLMADAGVDFPLIHASAEQVPLPAAAFDIVFCDHGAMTFADPYRTRPQGRPAGAAWWAVRVQPPFADRVDLLAARRGRGR